MGSQLVHRSPDEIGLRHGVRLHEVGPGERRLVYTPHVSLLFAGHAPGAGSQPSCHEGEELDLVLSGEVRAWIERTRLDAKAGDYVRIPGAAMHWAQVVGDEPVRLMHAHTPPFIDGAPPEHRIPMLLPGEEESFPVSTDIAGDTYPKELVENLHGDVPTAVESAYLLRGAAVSEGVVDAGSGSMPRSQETVFTPHVSLMTATRPPGLQSQPSAHEGEELQYVLAGQGWLFTEDGGIGFSAGDVVRIAAGVAHWGRVVGDTPCVILHVHTPPFVGSEELARHAHALVTDREQARGFQTSSDIAVSTLDVERIERTAMEGDHV